MKNYTVSYNDDERVRGWTSFHSFEPEYMVGMNNSFFSFKNGDLYIHHSDEVKRNQFYGKQFPSKVSLMFNDFPSEVKEIKALSLEGSSTWETLIKAYVSSTDDLKQSSIKEVEFVKKEGMWYAYARRDESSSQTDSKSVYGIGRVESISQNTMIVNGYSDTITVGDKLVNGNDFKVVGEISEVKRNLNKTEITLDVILNINEGDFVCGMKDPRVEGGNLRGYTIRTDLETTKDEKIELFAVNIEAIKSYK